MVHKLTNVTEANLDEMETGFIAFMIYAFDNSRADMT